MDAHAVHDIERLGAGTERITPRCRASVGIDEKPWH